MAQSDLRKSLLSGAAPENLRMAIARRLAPLPPGQMLELLVCLLKDADPAIAAQAAESLRLYEEQEIASQLKLPDCPASVLEHFAVPGNSHALLQAVIANPSSPDTLIASLARTVPAPLLDSVLDNRVRLIGSPDILEGIRQNPSATPEALRLAQEIETEFLGAKKKEYSVEEPAQTADAVIESLGLDLEKPPDDLVLEGLPVEEEAREAAISQRLTGLSFPEKVRHALFGNREIRMMLIRDTNREVARSVLRSPKLTDSEIETIAAMRGVGEEILREIGTSKERTKSYSVVQNLIKNPKTPAFISQRLLIRLHTRDLTQLTRDRSVPDAVRYNAARALNQRSSSRQQP